MAPEIYIFVRWLHVTFGAAWLGEVVVINFILIPALSKYDGIARKDFLATIFPKVFNLASILAGVTAITGGILLYHFIGFNVGKLTESGAWGWSILIAGSLGFVLTIFHFFIENLLARKIGISKDMPEEAAEDIHLKLKIIPRLGLVVISIIFLLMLNAKHTLISF